MMTFQIQGEIEEVLIDYMLTVDEQGEIVSVKPLIYDLPEMAQRLILGQKYGLLDRKIQAYSQLIPFIFSLVLNKRLSSYKKNFEEVIVYIQSLPTFKQEVLETYWDNIELMIEKKGTGTVYDAIRNLAYNHRTIAPYFLPAVIPFFQNNAKRIAFESLEYANPEKLKAYLLKELEEPSSDPYASGILKALAKIGQPFDDIFEAVTNYYYREGDKTEDTLANLTEVLKKYPQKVSKAIGFDILRLNKRYSALYAARLLVETFNADKEVVDIIMPYFLEADPRTSEAAFAIFCNVGLINYLPSPEKVLEIYTKTSAKRQNSNIAYCMPTIGKATGLTDLYDEIYALLDHEKASVKEGILILISCIIDEQKYAKYRTPKFMDKYLALILEDNEKVIRNAMRIVSRVARHDKKTAYVDILLEIINKHDKNTLIRLDAMKAINTMLENIPYQPQIEPIYLKALEERNYNYPVAALNGFKYSPDETFKKSLFLKYEKNASDDVRRAAERLLKPLPKKDLSQLKNSLMTIRRKRSGNHFFQSKPKDSSMTTRIVSFFKNLTAK